MRHFKGKLILIGDRPSTPTRKFWDLMGWCKKCGGELKEDQEYQEDQEDETRAPRSRHVTRTKNACTRCGHIDVSRRKNRRS
ncbi:hypothetical protein LCGC14_1513810 [marine sediment metagenome]|uniref:Uncharacterized protein n=1 Tax=marine sediment metagenome TaxID=412755 RepID=A0A0F9JLC5_9ZZZZ